MLRETPATPPQGGWRPHQGRPGERSRTTPTLTAFAEDRLCTADPLRGREAMLRETPATPPEGPETASGAGITMASCASGREHAAMKERMKE